MVRSLFTNIIRDYNLRTYYTYEYCIQKYDLRFLKRRKIGRSNDNLNRKLYFVAIQDCLSAVDRIQTKLSTTVQCRNLAILLASWMQRNGSMLAAA